MENAFFCPINFNKLNFDQSDLETQESMLEYDFEYNYNLKEKYQESLVFFSQKSLQQIDFEIFSSYKGIRFSEYFNNLNIIQEYFYKKYKLKYFEHIVNIDKEDEFIAYSESALFNSTTKITNNDYIDIIKPNLKIDILKIKDDFANNNGKFKIAFNWEFFINETYYNLENTLVSRYETSIPYNFENEYENEYQLYFKLFEILFECTHATVDTHLNGLILPNDFELNDELLKFFDVQKWLSKIELFPKERNFNVFYNNIYKDEISFLNDAKKVIETFSKNIPIIKIIA